jgi:hypothetical protein
MIDGVMAADGVTMDTTLLVVMADGVMVADLVTVADSKGMVVAGSRIQDMAAEAIAADPNGHRISLAQSCKVDSMPTPLLALRDSSFPMADCAPCGKSVLTYVALDDNGAERRICVHCDTPIAENLKWVSPGELEQAGYYFGPPPAEGEKGGCSTGCGSCSVKKN